MNTEKNVLALSGQAGDGGGVDWEFHMCIGLRLLIK